MSNEADYTGLTQGGSPWNISHVVGKFPYWLSLVIFDGMFYCWSAINAL